MDLSAIFLLGVGYFLIIWSHCTSYEK